VAAMGEVSQLVTGVDRHFMTAVFVFVTLALQIFVPYHRYVNFLKWLTLSLLHMRRCFHGACALGEVALRTVWPKFTFDSNAAAMIVGVFGTTISPYLFFWQASEEVEDMHAGQQFPLKGNSHQPCPSSGECNGTRGAACFTPI